MSRNYIAELDDRIGCMGGKIVHYQSDSRNGSKQNIKDLYNAAVLQFGRKAKHCDIMYSYIDRD